MARYDSPGFAGAFPTGDRFDSHDDALTAHGSAGIPALTNEGPALGTYTDHAAGYLSTQAPAPERTVYAGDSQSMSDDIACHGSAINGDQPESAMNSYGTWHGHAQGASHPDSMFGRGPEVAG